MLKTRKRSPISKDERCRLVNCPNYIGPTASEGAAKNSNPMCEHCQGPVVWRDNKGIQHGMARACTSCPMNGRGLPVCFCACQGPGENLATDGQKIVTVGGMDDEASYIHKNIDLGYARERSEAKDGWVTVIDGDEGDNLAKGDSQAAENKIRLVVFRRLIAESGQGFVELLKVCNNRTSESYKKRVTYILHLPPQMEAVARSVISAIGEVTAVQWEIVRGLATGKNRAQIARLLGVKKQAVHQAVGRLERGSCSWISALVKHCQ